MKSFYKIVATLSLLPLWTFGGFLLWLLPLWLSAQSSSQNYVVTTAPYQVVNDPSSLTDANSNTTIQYFDGLGRPSQTVQRAITPNAADLVSPVEYDEFGREWKKYQPAIAAGNSGQYKVPSTLSYTDRRPFSEIHYEASPLNRVDYQYGPGNDWFVNGKKTKISYETNDGSISNFYVNGSKQLAKGTNYDPGTLYKTVTTDEDSKTTTEYKNKLGQVVLKRGEEGGHIDTYYVYNDLGQLCYVLPPKAVDELTSYGDDDAVMKQYCYLYQYDSRGNCIYKRLPGCTPIYMVYDKANHLVLSQDGNQRKRLQGQLAQWSATKYDLFGRVVFTGLMYRSEVDSAQNYKSIRDVLSNDVVTESYAAFASAIALTVNYYDNYNFISDSSPLAYQVLSGYNKAYPVTATVASGLNAKGLLTGTRTYLLDGSGNSNITANYYDDKGRVVQTRTSNHLGGYDLTYSELNFTGAPARTYKTHGINGASATVTELYTYTYNKAQQPLITTYSLNGSGTVTLASNSYDELGRLVGKQRHTGADTESFGYNIRNWTTNIASSGFVENLYYNTNPLNSNATYNGNISYSTWTYNGATNGYLYNYDGLNRLLSSNFKQVSSGLGDDSFNEAFTYDKMGNILTLKRKKNYTQIDDLVFHYSNNEKSNQLQYVDDGGATQNQYFIKEYQNKSTSQAEFAYDANGNMTKDLDRDIYTIKYNVLNLPDVVQFKNGNQIKNTYNASGQKLGTEYFTWLPLANAPLINIGDVLNIGYSQGAIDQSGTAHIGNVEYNTKNGNSSLTAVSRIYNTEGYVENISSPNYYYYRKDHLGNNREVWLANTNTTKQWTQYYPSGLPWVTTLNDNLSTQPYKYSDKEFVEMHGLDEYDSQARWFYPAIVRTPTLDPHCENYFDISPYAWCGNNPVNGIDPDGRDYWTTNDPATIERFINSMQQVGGSQLPSETFNYGKWKHATDAQFTGALTYNDENQTFYSSYGTVENGQSVIHGIQIKAASFGDGNASVQTEKGKWYDKSSGAIKQENVEFAILVGGSKVGLSVLSWLWNNIINPPAPSTINTFNANAGKSFRPGKQNSRDANLKQFPKDFQRWFHRFGKEDGNFNATTQELREMFDEWIRMGKPQIK